MKIEFTQDEVDLLSWALGIATRAALQHKSIFRAEQFIALANKLLLKWLEPEK
jgi:hypothetical protein